ncbi:MAG: 2-hydroxyacyl-CoA dehydratase subunit D [Smithellaceae bacterium]
MMTDFKSIIGQRHSILSDLSKQGRKVLGYMGSYCPEELVYAAGLLPVRILGTEKPFPQSDRHVQQFYCSYSRGCLEEALTNEGGYLQGVFYAYGCDHIRGAFDSCLVNIPKRYYRYLDMPGWVDRPAAVEFYTKELENFQKSLEDWFKVKITEESLRKGIELCNRNRTLLRELYALLKEKTPKVTGAQVSAAIFSSMVYPKDMHNTILEQYLAEVRKKEGSQSGARVMIIGTEFYSPRLLEVIEEQGALVVADELSTGSRYIWEDVKTEGPLLEAVALRYLRGINDPVKHPVERRLKHIDAMLEEFKAEKVIFLLQKGCDPVEWLVPMIGKKLKEKGIPQIQVTVGGDSLTEDIKQVAQATRALIGG